MSWTVSPLRGKTTDWRAGCGRSARPVRREGGSKPIDAPYPYHVLLPPTQQAWPGRARPQCPRGLHEPERSMRRRCRTRNGRGSNRGFGRSGCWRPSPRGSKAATTKPSLPNLGSSACTTPRSWPASPLAGDTINRRAGCGRSARPVRREGVANPIAAPYPYHLSTAPKSGRNTKALPRVTDPRRRTMDPGLRRGGDGRGGAGIHSQLLRPHASGS